MRERVNAVGPPIQHLAAMLQKPRAVVDAADALAHVIQCQLDHVAREASFCTSGCVRTPEVVHSEVGLLKVK